MKLPPYKRFPEILADRISLREIQHSDIKDLVEISFYNGIKATTAEEAAEMQAKITGDYLAGNSIHWGIADNFTNKIVGTCGYYRGLEKGEGELGCVLLPQFRGQGFMTAAMLLAIDFGLNTIGLKRIWAATSRKNEKALQLLKQLNFTKITNVDADEIKFELRHRV